MEEGNSRIVVSNQDGVHEHLESTVRKHQSSEFKKPYAEHTLAAFQQAQAWLNEREGKLILDSCCGVGESSRNLARLYPDALVIGVDKSAHRLAKHEQQGDNFLLVQADLNDFWRLAVEAGWKPWKHFVLYPNPWPKSAHLKRRWHASAVFPSLVVLGGELELRSNWQLYLQEFAVALDVYGIKSDLSEWQTQSPLTPFERKYLASGQACYRLTANL